MELKEQLEKLLGPDFRISEIPTWALENHTLLDIWIKIDEFMYWVKIVGGDPELAKAKVQEIIQTTPTGYLEAMEIVKTKIALGEPL